MAMSETLSLQAALDLVEAATTTSGEELEANLPQLVALFHLPNSATGLEDFLVLIHCFHRCFYHLHQLTLEAQEADFTPIDSYRLSVLTNLCAQLLNENAEPLANLALDFTLTRVQHFVICQAIIAVARPSYPLLPESVSAVLIDMLQASIKAILLRVLDAGLAYEFSSSHRPHHLFCLANILEIPSSILKDAYRTSNRDKSLAIWCLTVMGSGGHLSDRYQAFVAQVVMSNQFAVFERLTEPILVLSKRSMKSSKICGAPPILLPRCCLKDFLVATEDAEQLRSISVARKLIELLRTEYQVSGTFFDELLSCIIRIIPIIFPNMNSQHVKVESSTNALVKRSYRQEEENLENDNADPFTGTDQRLVLQRNVVLNILIIGGTLVSSTERVSEAISSVVVLLTRTLATRGLFHVNPLVPFLHLLSEQDDHLVQGLYWLQTILMANHHGSPLLDVLKEKSPPFANILRIMNPFSLFASFLHSIHYDHSILMDFLLSGETEAFLRYLLDFVKFCLMDWNRTFIVLYDIKIKKSTPAELVDAAGFQDDVDALLEMLLERQMQELNISSTPSNSHMTTSASPPTVSSSAIDSLLQSSVEAENAFDATITALIRLLFHLENATEHQLFAYNLEPLILRLQQVESLYEKLQEDETT